MQAPHPLRTVPELGTPAFCENCHDFQVPGFVDGHFGPTDTPMQTTTAEWRAWRADGGKQTCQDCHMPRGAHTFVGASDADFLRRAVRVRAKRRGDSLAITLSTHGVGHHVPSGDIFRQLVVEVDDGAGFVEIARFGRALESSFDPLTGDHHMELVRDNALQPGEPVTVEVLAPPASPWRVRYLYTSEPALIAVLSAEDAAVVLHAGAR